MTTWWSRPNLRARLLCAVVVLYDAPATARTSPEDSTVAMGRAQGRLTVAGKAIPLAFAYAWTQPSVADPSKKLVVVLLLDQGLPAGDKPSEFTLLKKTGKIHGLMVMLNKEQQVVSAELSHPDRAWSAVGMHRFEAATVDGKTVSGRLYTPRPEEWQPGKTWEYNAVFKAAIQ